MICIPTLERWNEKKFSSDQRWSVGTRKIEMTLERHDRRSNAGALEREK
jgi:hypothetical protein